MSSHLLCAWFGRPSGSAGCLSGHYPVAWNQERWRIAGAGRAYTLPETQDILWRGPHSRFSRGCPIGRHL